MSHFNRWICCLVFAVAGASSAGCDDKSSSAPQKAANSPVPADEGTDEGGPGDVEPAKDASPAQVAVAPETAKSAAVAGSSPVGGSAATATPGTSPSSDSPSGEESQPKSTEVGLASKKDREVIRRVVTDKTLDDKLQRSLSRLGPGPTGRGSVGLGSGHGAGIGADCGPNGERCIRGGTARATKPRSKVDDGPAGGELGELTAKEIQKVMKARKGLIRACYQAELSRDPELAGKLVISFRITKTGKVRDVEIVKKKSSLRNDRVESCVERQISRLRFPAKGKAKVVYPFIFSLSQ